MNGTMIQYFHWYIPTNTLWKEVAEKASYLSSLGITSAWLPPAYKASTGADSVGYDPYDLYDLGNLTKKKPFEQNMVPRRVYFCYQSTSYLWNSSDCGHRAQSQSRWNEKEAMQAYRVDWNNQEQVTSDVRTIEAYTKFTFGEEMKNILPSLGIINVSQASIKI